MKIDPGFITHWKTELLMERLGSDAVVAVLRLWGNAQIRRQFTGLELNPRRLALETKWRGDAGALFDTLTDPDAPWLDLDADGTYSIHDFGQHQKQVVALWENGNKGGRPKKEKNNTLPLPLPLTPLGYEMEPNGFQTKPNGFDEEEDESLCDRVFQEVSTIRKAWAATPFTAAERGHIKANAAIFRSITPQQWETIGQFTRAKLERGDASFQPKFRHKLIDSIAVVASQAAHWGNKAQSKVNAFQMIAAGQQTPAQTDEDKAALTEFMKNRKQA